MCVLNLFIITAQLSINVRMRKKPFTIPPQSYLIDEFELSANSSNCNKAIQLDGDLEIASILFKYELICANMSTCQPVPNTSLQAACSKTCKIYEYICIINCTLTYFTWILHQRTTQLRMFCVNSCSAFSGC